MSIANPHITGVSLYTLFSRTLPAIYLLFTQTAGAISFQQVNGPFAQTEAWGSSWGDFNNDRCPDLFVNHHRDEAALYKNNCDGSFKDITQKVDVDRSWLDGNRYADQHGAAWADYDSDGDQDLYITTGSRWDGELLVNENGVLRNRTVAAGLQNDREGRMPLWVDYNNNRLLDLVIQSRTRSWTLQHNQSNGAFLDSSANTNFNIPDAINFSNLTDLDNNGTLEYLGVPEGTFPQAAFDMTNMPFRNITSNIPSIPMVVDTAVADFNGDQLNDLLLVRGRLRPFQSKQFGSNVVETWFTASPGDGDQTIRFKAPNGNLSIGMYSFLGLVRYYFGSGGYHPGDNTRINSTSFHFTLSAGETLNHGIKPHSSTVPADRGVYIGYHPSTQEWEVNLANGGQYTTAYVVVTSTAPVSNLVVTGLSAIDLPLAPVVLLNNGQGFAGNTVPLSQASNLGALDTPVSCISAAAADFDNDMDPDVYLVCRGGVENIANRLYENSGSGQFSLVANAGGALGPIGSSVTDGCSLADNVTVADYDGDGLLDMFVTNGVQLFPVRFDSPDQLYRNITASTNRWIELDLVGTLSNQDGIGAKVYATAGGVTQIREQSGGHHRWSQNHQRIHFGLGSNQTVDLRVEWPSGLIETYNSVSANGLYQVTENQSITQTQLGPVSPDPGGGTKDNVEVLRALYIESSNAMWVQASSDLQPLSSALLTAIATTDGIDEELGRLNWNAANNAYQSTFNNVATAPDCITVNSSGGGSNQLSVEGTGDCSDGFPTGDNLNIVSAIYFTADNRIWIRATSDAVPVGSSNIAVTLVTGTTETELGEIGWKADKNYYQQVFQNILQVPDSVILNSNLGGTSTAPVTLQ